MIERKRGQIVAIASITAKMSLPLGITYSTTKAAVKNFMECLQEELYCYGHENFVKLTTVFPGFIATRKELTDVLDKTFELTVRLSPPEVADQIVKGMLANKRDITLPKRMSLIAAVLRFVTVVYTHSRKS